MKGAQTVKITGKNRISIPNGTKIENGITWTREDGVVHGSGTLETYTWSNLVGTTTLSLPAGDYTFSIKEALPSPLKVEFSTRDNDNVRKNYQIPAGQTSVTKSFPNGLSWTGVALVGGTVGQQIDVTIENIQVEPGSTATAYEAYQGQTFPVDLIGKNLFSGWIIGKKLNGSGVETADQNGAVSDFIPVTSNTNYIFSDLPDGLYTFIAAYNYQKQFLGRTGSSGGSSSKGCKTLPSYFSYGTPAGTGDVAYLRVTAYQSGQYADPITVINSLQTQLEVGTTATTYVPYYNYELCKIGNYQDYIFKSSGKNLVDAIDSTWQTNNTTLTKTDGIFRMTAASGKIAGAVLPLTGLIEGETYTISFDALGVSVGTDNVTYLRVREGSSGGDWVGNGVKINASSDYVRYSTTFVATSVSDPWAWFYLSASASNTNNVDIYVKNIQLEKSSTTTPYEPYGTDWYVYKETGKTVLDGDENVYVAGTQTSGRNRFFVDGPDDMKTHTNTEGKGLLYSDKFIELTNTQSLAGTIQGMFVRANGDKQFVINYYGVTTGSQFKTWISANNVTAYYALATPTYTKITDNTLIGQLDAVHDWLRRYDYYGVVSGNLPIIIDRTGII